MEVVLIRVTPEGVKGEMPIKVGMTVVGRGEDTDLRVPVRKVSREHCRIEVTPEGNITITDLGSSNGTYVNQEKVTSRPLAAGDAVSFGGLVFVVRVNGEPDEIEADLMYEDGIPEKEESTPLAPSAVNEPQPMVPAGDLDDSSVSDFEFDLNEDEDEDQPPL